MAGADKGNTLTGNEIAVIGMDGRFPGAGNLEVYWNNLKDGVESVSFYSEEELKGRGVDRGWLDNPDYIKSPGGYLEDREFFDAAFFGYTPDEAKVMDPQARIFLECAWGALENAGYDPEAYDGLIGLYAGASSGFEWEALTYLSGKMEVLGEFAVLQLRNRDFLGTRAAHKLNLRGPAIMVQSACSTSLLAIHLACQSILDGECDMALAGGVGIIPPGNGFIYQEGMIISSDGHCRAFDARSTGTIGGGGIGVVVLKGLEQAVADGDYIYAVIKGTAANNDGMYKAGYSAPSREGQTKAIRAALRVAEVEPESITYVETHGTGTTIGDPIEIEALKRAFNTGKKMYCALGSVKTNIGHLDAAAGVAGFIKTVLALKHRLIPPTLHFEIPNPKIDFENSPFYVNTKPTEWKRDRYPLRAGVSSFGIGGTNIHVVLEEGTRDDDPNPASSDKTAGRGDCLVVLSARTESALEKAEKNLVEYLQNHPEVNLDDVAYTLLEGRKAFKYRRAAVCSTITETIAAFTPPGEAALRAPTAKDESPKTVFMFPGQGSQYVDMGQGLYEREPVFREEMDRCFEILKPLMEFDIKGILYPRSNRSGQSNRSGSTGLSGPKAIHQTEIAQPLIFAIEYSLVGLLREWGIKPYAMIGHSIGEYVAACISGVLTLEDALKLVAIRGKLMQKVSPGAMLAVSLPESQLNPLLEQYGDGRLALAAVNSPSSCVVSGPAESVKNFSEVLGQKGCKATLLHTSHAFHSGMMDPLLPGFEAAVKNIPLNSPKIPYISNLTGQWISVKDATNPSYWANHLRHTVRFSDGIENIIKNGGPVFIEVGPGKTLTTLVRQQSKREKEGGPAAINLVRHPQDNHPDHRYLLGQLGRLWVNNVALDWSGYYRHQTRVHRRIPLPTYPFERQRYWLEGRILNRGGEPVPGPGQLRKRPNPADWFYIPSWERSMWYLPPRSKQEKAPVWLVLADPTGLGTQLARRLKQDGMEVITVGIGESFSKINEGEYVLDPAQEDGCDALFKELKQRGKVPANIFHLWGITGADRVRSNPEAVEKFLDRGFYSVLNIARAAHRQHITSAFHIGVVTDHHQEVNGTEDLDPVKAVQMGAVKVIPREYPNISCTGIDIILPDPGTPNFDILIEQLIGELSGNYTGKVVAYRDRYRWEQIIKPVGGTRSPGSYIPSKCLRDTGVYLVTGGLGGIGITLARYLAQRVKAKLILVGRSALPPRQEWENRLTAHPGAKEDAAAAKINTGIREILQLEALGAEVLVISADVADKQQMQRVIDQAGKRFGPINGVIHAAGLADGMLIQLRSRQMTRGIMAPKILGTLVLDELLTGAPLDFFILCSSLGSILGPLAQVGYCAANAFLDAFAHYKTRQDKYRRLTTSINWDTWQEVGMAVEAAQTLVRNKNIRDAREILEHGIKPSEGVEVFDRIINFAGIQPQVVISTTDLSIRIRQQEISLDHNKENQIPADSLRPRPGVKTADDLSGKALEKHIAAIWQSFFGIEEIGRGEDFFELGGDSLKAMSLLQKIHRELGYRVSLPEFFANPTIEKMAKCIDGGRKSKFFSIEPAETKEYYPLSSGQKRLYILQQMDLETTAYHMTQLTGIQGELDIETLEDTLKKLIHRHESLRTSFEIIGDGPVQRVHARVDFQVENYKIQDPKPGVEVKVEVKEKAPLGQILNASGQGQEEPSPLNGQGRGEVSSPSLSGFIRPFDLSRPPLLRIGIVKIDAVSYLLGIDMHHIITDGLSHRLLMEEFDTLYRGQRLPGLKLQYKDYAEWQQSPGVKKLLKEQEDYWLKEMGDELPVLNLPTDYPRPPLQSFAGHTIPLEMGNEVTEALGKIAAEEGVTLFMVILALFNILLSKISGQEDIVVGIDVSGRSHADLEKIIGMFVNMLPLRMLPAPGKTFNDFLMEVRDKTLTAFDNQSYQFEDLVEQVDIQRDVSRNPIFDMMFSFMDADKGTIPGEMSNKRDTDLDAEPYIFENKTSKFDLTLIVDKTSHQLNCSFEYCTKLFKQSTIQRFVSYFRQITASVISDRNQKISGIEILTEAERHRLLCDFNDTEADYPREKSIDESFSEQVERSPYQIALIGQILNSKPQFYHRNISLTYKELKEKSVQLAGLLKENGVQPDVIVGIMTERSIEMILGIVGILKAGGAYLPIDPAYPEERINYMLADSKAKILLTTPGTQAKVKAEVEEKSKEIINISDLLSSPSTCQVRSGYRVSQPGPLAYVIYTSGSTGKPKGVMVSHKNTINFIKAMISIIDFSQGKSILALTTISFDIFFLETVLPLICGMKVVVASEVQQQDPELLAAAIMKNMINILQVTPSRLQLLLNFKDDLQYLQKVETLIVGGEVFPKLLFENITREFPGKIYNVYGPTETTIWSTVKDLTGSGLDELTIGSPIANTQIYIVNTEMALQPLGVPGELLIGGDGVARGYLNNPGLTAEKFLSTVNGHSSFVIKKLERVVINSSKRHSKSTNNQCPMTNDRSYSTHSPHSPYSTIYRTGDLARWQADGNIQFLGRIDSQVKLRGFRIELGEIETKLAGYPQIKENVVIALDAPGGGTGGGETGKSLAAYFVSDPDIPAAALKEYLQEELPDYMIPTYFVRLDRMPLTSSGKINRKALPLSGLGTTQVYTAPRTALEEKLADMWAKILGVERNIIGIDSNFFDLGGNSLNVTLLIARVHKELNVKLPMAEIFKSPRLKRLSQLIEETIPERFTAIEPVEKREYYRLSSAQSRLYFIFLFTPTGTAYNMPNIMALEGGVNKDKLEKTFNDLIARHESLRTSYAMLGSAPVQKVHDFAAVPFEYDDLSNKEDGNGDEAATGVDQIIKKFVRPHDLAQAPLLRVGLVKVTSHRYILMTDLHHIVTDGISGNILIRDFMALNNGELLPPLKLQYKDFSEWQNRWLASAAMQVQEKYWLDRFQGDTPVLDLPTDYPRPSLQTSDKGGIVEFVIEKESAARLYEAIRETGTTLFMFLLAINTILLSKYSDQEDIVVGSPVTGRRHENLQDIIGIFLNMLCLRNQPRKEKTFRQFLEEVKTNAINAYENQDFQFDALVTKLGFQGTSDRNPLFNVVFAAITRDDLARERKGTSYPAGETNGALIVKPYEYNEYTAKFDLRMAFVEMNQRVMMSLTYAASLFKPATAQRLTARFIEILNQVLENPDIKLKDITIPLDLIVTRSDMLPDYREEFEF